MPTRARSRRYPFELAAVAWADLLGYGAMLATARFHPKDPTTVAAIARLRGFQQVAMAQATRSFRAMPINDGVAFFQDLGPRSTSVTADFLKRAIDAYVFLNNEDGQVPYPGVRMVISIGPRARIGRPKRSTIHLRKILDRLANCEITPEQAVNEAFRTDPVTGFVPALQANFAFTRAYLAESGGTSKGFGGAKCFIDLTLFDQQLPEWITFSRQVKWSDRGFEADFGEFASADWTAAGRSNHHGIRTTQDLAGLLGMDRAYS